MMGEDSLRGANRTFVQHVQSIDNDHSSDTFDTLGLCLREFFQDITGVRRLTEQDPSICTRRNAVSGAYPIHLAVCGGHTEIVEYLLELAPLSVRFQSLEGALPIHLASYYGHKQICSLLFNLDPSTLTAQTHHGLTAEDIAQQNGHAHLTDILQFAVSYMDYSPAAHQGTHSTAHEEAQPAQSMPAVQIPSPQQLAEASYDSANNGITTHVDVSQLLLDEFHRASLLEIEEEPEISSPLPGMVRYEEKFPRMVPSRGSPRGGAGTNSVLLNLSEELVTSQQAQRHSLRGANADKLLAQGLAGQTLATPSPFMFQPVSTKPSPRVGTAKGYARPRTAGVEALPRATTAHAAQARSGRPLSTTTTTTGPATPGEVQVYKTVQTQVLVETSVPALVITSAAMQRPSTSKQCSRAAHRAGTGALLNDQTTTGTVNPSTPASPVVTLRRPPSRPSSPRASSLPLRAYNGTRVAMNKTALQTTTCRAGSPGRDGPPNMDDKAGSLSAEGQSLPCPESPRQQQLKKAIIKTPASSNLQFVKYALETRRLEPTASPLRDSGAASEVATASAEQVAAASSEQVLSSRPHVHTVTIDTSLPGLSSGNHPETWQGAVLNQSHRAFAPPRALRPSSRAGPTSATGALAQQSPAARRRLDLHRMAEEAARIAEDSTFVPSLRPLPRSCPSGIDSASPCAPQRDLANSLASRAHRLEMAMLHVKEAAEAMATQQF